MTTASAVVHKPRGGKYPHRPTSALRISERTINGLAHGPGKACTTCQLYMRSFVDGETITVEPWKVKSFPILKDLVTDRSAFDRIIQAGGYVRVPLAPERLANDASYLAEQAQRFFDAGLRREEIDECMRIALGA